MRKLIFSLLFALCVLPGSLLAQRVLVHEEPDTSGEIPLYGKNRSLYVHPLMKLGVFAPVYEKGLRLNFWSTSVSAEARMKAKICRWNALVLDFGYRCDRFILDQKDSSYLPWFTGNHKRERLSTHNLSFALCDRINFGKRGDILGIYLDFGFYGDFLMRGAHLVVDEYYDSNSPVASHVKSKTKLTQLNYLNRLNYGFTARFGWEWGSFYAMYRMTDLIMDESVFVQYPDMPRVVAGVELYFLE